MLLLACFELGALGIDQLALVLIEAHRPQHADHLQVLLDDMAQLGDDGRHELTARLPIATARVEHGLELIDQEGDVATLAEHRRDDARQRDDPLEVIEVLGVDEDLERPALFVLGALVEHDVVDGHVHRVIRDRCFDLVGRADQHLGTLDLLVHADDLGGRAILAVREFGVGYGGDRRLVIGLADAVLDDAAVDLQ